MKFAKTLIAAAMLVGAGSANASIAYDKGGLNEAYLSAYDSTTGKTFTLDTGVTYNELVANVNNAAYSLNFDLSALSNWTNFITGANISKIKYLVAVGDSADLGAAVSGAPLVLDPNVLFGVQTANAIQNHAIDINSKVVVNNAQNLSTLVLDSESAGSGQHQGAENLWQGWATDLQAGYGQAVGFQLGAIDLNEASPTFLTDVFVSFKGEWKLAGNSLTFAAPAVAAVPLPAAVWMFGAGLMGVLRLNRRKSMAV